MPETKRRSGAVPGAGRSESVPAGRRRSGLMIMISLIGLVKPLLHVMMAAIILGTAGYLCAIFLTILAGHGILEAADVYNALLPSKDAATVTGAALSGSDMPRGLIGGAGRSLLLLIPSMKALFLMMASIAVLRGILHYAEQYCNHFIAFKLLAIIRHQVFAALRRLCPAKLEGKDKGNLISIITTDIELLEVFYAHTISPIAIAALTSVLMSVFIGSYNAAAGLFAAGAYVIVGVILPVINGRRGGQRGMEFRNVFGEMNSFVLDSLRGLDETIQYINAQERKEGLTDRSKRLASLQKELGKLEGTQRALTNTVILLCSFGMLFLTLYLHETRAMGFDGVVICTVSMMSSFGPVVALSSLSNNLNQTLASGERVLSLLAEEPVVHDIVQTTAFSETEAFSEAEANRVTFGYGEEIILDDVSLFIKGGQITGIHGASGSGKSTLLKLIMRFWSAERGEILVGGRNVEEIPTSRLRKLESYMTQETHLFHDSIANNIALAKPEATRDEIAAAAKKASIHDQIMRLPKGYDTEVGELGDTLSGGERQRIGLARAFLHDAPLLLLDEPTSNLDSLNEGIIIRSLKEAAAEKTVILVSHRKSTMNAADTVYEMKSGRMS